MQDYHEFLEEILIDAEQLQARVAELGAQIARDYAGMPKLMLVCILKGGMPFLADLMKHINVPHIIDFMSVSSYGTGRVSSGRVRIDFDLRNDPEGRHVLIVEDIVDSGNTLSYLTRILSERNPASLKICALLDKPGQRETEVTLDYVGFTIENKFVFGYGLDLDEYYRNLPFIGVVRQGAYIRED